MTPHAGSPHDAFGPFDVMHDIPTRLRSYPDSDEDGTDSEETTERIYIRPYPFEVYEFLQTPGLLYCTTSDLVLRQMFRRYRNSAEGRGAGFRHRVVRLDELEGTLRREWPGTNIAGYKLQDVLLTTHVGTYDVLGNEMENNLEAQDAKTKAGKIKAVAFSTQYGNQIIRAMVSNTGAVMFLDYPGDEIALVVHQFWIDGYKDFNFMRASAVVKRQSTFMAS